MSGLRVYLFGCPRICRDGAETSQATTRPAFALLSYLLLNGRRMHPREAVAERIWGDTAEEKARGALRTTLWRLRGELEPEGIARGAVLRAERSGEIGLNWESGLWCDACAFEAAVAPNALEPGRPISGAAAARLEEAVDLYLGDLMEGYYANWIIAERERLNHLYGAALVALLGEARRTGAWSTAIALGRRILAADPLRESVHREVIRCHMALGQRTEALKQFALCAEVLRRELGVAPMPETLALQAELLSAESGPAPRRPESRREITDALGAVETAMRQLAAAHARLKDQERRLGGR